MTDPTCRMLRALASLDSVRRPHSGQTSASSDTGWPHSWQVLVPCPAAGEDRLDHCTDRSAAAITRVRPAIRPASRGVLSMAKEFFNRDMEFFIDHRVDWARYFRLLRGADASWRDEVETYKMILRTAGEICESIEAGARDHWHEHVGPRGRRGGGAAAHRRRLREAARRRPRLAAAQRRVRRLRPAVRWSTAPTSRWWRGPTRA